MTRWLIGESGPFEVATRKQDPSDLQSTPLGPGFRQTPLPDESLRTLPSPDASELVYLRGGELDWNMLQRAAALVGLSDFGVRGLVRFALRHPRIVRIPTA